MKKILGIFLVVILTFIFGCCPKENGKVIMKTNSTLIDVRTIEEYKAGFITGAVNIPYDETIVDQFRGYMEGILEWNDYSNIFILPQW